MKLEKITDEKFRVIIHSKELKNNNININLNSLTDDGNLAQKLILSILKKIKKESNPLLDNSKLLVDFYVLDNDFLVLNITKHNLVDDVSSTKEFTYAFNDFENFCNFCSSISNLRGLKNISKKSSLYEYKSVYYLHILGTTDYDLDLLCNQLTEFSDLIDLNNFENYKIIEYGNVIYANNAIIKCLKHFNLEKIKGVYFY